MVLENKKTNNDCYEQSQKPLNIKTQSQSQSTITQHNNNNSKVKGFPIRPTINMGLIILITFQVYIVVSSHMYIRGSLNRSFLQLYVQQDKYPQLYEGLSFYLMVRNVSEVSASLEYMFQQIQTIRNNSFLELNLTNSQIILSVQYLNNLQTKSAHEKQFVINPQVGIIQPFNMSDIQSIQRFLLQVNWFKLSINNITLQQKSFRQKYLHQIVYNFQQGLQISVEFLFSIDDSKLDSVTIDKPQGNYILVMRGFYLLVLLMAIVSTYLNFVYVRKTARILFCLLGQKQPQNSKPTSIADLIVPPQDIQQITTTITKYITLYHITLSTLTFRHYFYIIEFDIIFSILSNAFTIVGSFYLLIGIEREIVVGVACLAAWMTVFKFIRNNKKLSLMYELIKLSILKVGFFFVEFFPVFLAYTFLGMCLFPKVSFFSSLSKAVTTLVSLMLGDSIQMITAAMMQKNSVTLSIIYIFSFVLMFMHAIHNTLTSLIKEAFILKKIELIQQEKKVKKQKDFLYISELKIKAEQQKDQLPIRLTYSLKKDLIRDKYLKHTKSIEAIIKRQVRQWERLSFTEKWLIEQNQHIISHSTYLEQLRRRLVQVNGLIEVIYDEITCSTLQNQSLITIQ